MLWVIFGGQKISNKFGAAGNLPKTKLPQLSGKVKRNASFNKSSCRSDKVENIWSTTQDKPTGTMQMSEKIPAAEWTDAYMHAPSYERFACAAAFHRRHDLASLPTAGKAEFVKSELLLMRKNTDSYLKYQTANQKTELPWE